MAGTVDCKVCKKGQSASYAYISCVLCQSGYAAPEEGMAECQACVPGSYTNGSGHPTCTLCVPGKTIGQLHAHACDQCAEGKAQPEAGSALEHCPDCEVGFFADKKGMATCQSCGVSHYNDLARQESCLPCLTFEVTFGFDRPNQCSIVWIISGMLVGAVVLWCMCCCWAKLGCPCFCCKCFKSKSRQVKFKKREKKSSGRSWKQHIEMNKQVQHPLSIEEGTVQVRVIQKQIPRRKKIRNEKVPVDQILWNDRNPMLVRSQINVRTEKGGVGA